MVFARYKLTVVFCLALLAQGSICGQDGKHRPQDVLQMVSELEDVDEWPDQIDESLIRLTLESEQNNPQADVAAITNLRLFLGRWLIRELRDPEAVAVMKPAVRGEKTDPRIEFYLELVEGNYGRWTSTDKRAFIDKQIAKSTYPCTTAELQGFAAMVEFYADNLQETQKLVEAGLKSDPSCQRLHACQIGLLMKQEKYLESVHAADLVFQSHLHKGKMYELFALRANSADMLRRYTDVARSYHRYIMLRPESYSLRNIYAFIHIAQAYLATGKPANARIASLWACMTNPNEPLPVYFAALASAQLNRYDDALQAVDMALRIDSDSLTYLALRGDILARLGKTEEATKCIDTIGKTGTKDSRAMLSWSYHRLTGKATRETASSVLKISSGFLKTNPIERVLWRAVRIRAFALLQDNEGLQRELEDIQKDLKSHFPDPRDTLASTLRADVIAIQKATRSGKPVDPVPITWLFYTR